MEYQGAHLYFDYQLHSSILQFLNDGISTCSLHNPLRIVERKLKWHRFNLAKKRSDWRTFVRWRLQEGVQNWLYIESQPFSFRRI